MINVDRQKDDKVVATAFMAHGITEASANLTSEVLVSADARDKHSHGLLRLPRFLRGIEHGHVDPDGETAIITEHRGVATLSGGSRLGPVVASEAITIELLAGTLVGAATGTDVTGTYHIGDPCTKGDPFDGETEIASMVDDEQFETVVELFEQTVEQGATVRYGGNYGGDLGTRVFEPTSFLA